MGLTTHALVKDIKRYIEEVNKAKLVADVLEGKE